ncbi:hypothetical protein, partial [Ramlibacter sp.]|uniref:hypothetical protein n=1 Tax=Ramlibacter sp. TaxID=1917967 RepID=UPI00262C3A4A
DDPEDVAVRLQSMRAANDDTADLWRRIADRLKRQGGASSLSILLAVAMLLGASFTEPVQAAPTLLQDAGLALRIMSTQVQKLGLVGSARHPDWLSHD